MGKYTLSTEGRHYLNAILPSFIYDRIANIRGSIENVIKSENGNISEANILRLYILIESFLEKNGFGHSVDYVFIIDKKGEELKVSGSLEAYEKVEHAN